MINLVWQRATPIHTEDPSVERRDVCGARIRRADYGLTSKATGWEIDHVMPVAEGGGDDLINLQPLQWQNNWAKGDMWPAVAYCVVRD